MSTGLEAIRERMADYLTARGVRAVTAWPGEARPEQLEPAVVVSLRGCRVGPAGFQDYLGERYDEQTGLWEDQPDHGGRGGVCGSGRLRPVWTAGQRLL